MLKSAECGKSREKSILGMVEGENPFIEGLKDGVLRSVAKLGLAKRLLGFDGVVGLLFGSGLAWTLGCCWGRWTC